MSSQLRVGIYCECLCIASPFWRIQAALYKKMHIYAVDCQVTMSSNLIRDYFYKWIMFLTMEISNFVVMLL